MNSSLSVPPASPVERVSFAARMRQLKPSAIREILKTAEAPHIISFAGGLPAPELFPVGQIAAAAQEVLTADGPAALQYGVTEGYAPLRRWVSESLRRTVNLSATESRVLITHGSQQALDLVGKVLLDAGDTVLVENPSYLGALQAFQAYEARFVALPCDDEGLRSEALEDALRRSSARPKFLYLVSNFQNPTGRTLSAARRVEVAALAARYGLLVVEDDPYGQLRFDGEHLPALCAKAEGPWVHLGTASKVLTPGLRVAWLSTNDDGLFQRLVTAKQAADLHTSTFNQRIVHRLVTQREWSDQHVTDLRSVYGQRRDVMMEALREYLPAGVECTKPQGGMFLWLTLPGKVDTLSLLEAAMKVGVAFVPGAPFWVGEPPTNTLRLNFSNATEVRIRTGMARLGELLRNL